MAVFNKRFFDAQDVVTQVDFLAGEDRRETGRRNVVHAQALAHNGGIADDPGFRGQFQNFVQAAHVVHIHVSKENMVKVLWVHYFGKSGDGAFGSQKRAGIEHNRFLAAANDELVDRENRAFRHRESKAKGVSVVCKFVGSGHRFTFQYHNFFNYFCFL